jgi:hypothetical protein
MRTSSASGAGTTPVHFVFAAGVTPPRLTGGACLSTLCPEQRAIQRLQGVYESPGFEPALAQTLDVSEMEMIAIGRAQLEKWMSVPTGTVHPVNVAYAPRQNGYDLWGFIQAASETARHLMSIT